MFYADLDHFKEVNDSLGHAVGDILLREAARRFVSCVRHTDTVARLGGDEFVVVVDANDEAALLCVAEKLVSVFAEPIKLAGRNLRISPSIGLSRYPLDGPDAPTLLQTADAAMYRAKSEGRNTYRSAADGNGVPDALKT